MTFYSNKSEKLTRVLHFQFENLTIVYYFVWLLFKFEILEKLFDNRQAA